MLLLELAQRFSQNKIPYTLVGGYALALQGIVRATMDIDLVVSLSEAHLTRAELILRELGLQSRLPISAKDVAHFHEEYRTQRNLIAWSFTDYKDPSRQVDLLIYPPLSQIKAQTISLHGIKVRVATKSSLLEMKLAANRPEDQLDIQRLQEVLRGKKT